MLDTEQPHEPAQAGGDTGRGKSGAQGSPDSTDPGRRRGNRVKRRRRPSTGPFTTARGMLPLTLVVGFFFATPILMLGVGAFRNAPPAHEPAWSFDAFGRTFSDPATFQTFINSFVLALTSAILSTAVALVLVFLVTRTTTPLRRIVTSAMVLVLALPPLFYAISWGMLGNPHIGFINVLWQDITDSEAVLFNAYSWEGLISVYVVKGASFCYLLLLGPFSAMDRSLEEAAQVSGAGRMRTMLGIDLAVLAPAITGVMILQFVIALEGFDVPLFLGTPAGIDVFSTQIYGFIADQSPADYGGASVLSLFLVVLVGVLVAIQWKILGRRKFTTVTGKSYNTAPWDIGRWRWVGTAFIIFYIILGIVLPMLQLVYGSLQPFFGGGSLSLVNYEQLLNDPRIVLALQSTFLVALLGGLVAMVIAFTVVYAMTHNDTWLRRLLEAITWLPYAVPGIVLALGMAWMFVTIPGFREAYGSLLLVGVALIVAAVPLATRVLQPALQQLNRELEEAGRVGGARPHRVVWRIVMPLILPTFLSGWFVVAIVISGNLAIPILLSSAQSPTVPLLVYELHTLGNTSRAAALLVVVLGSLLIGLLIITQLGRLPLFRHARRPARTTSPTEPSEPTTHQPAQRDDALPNRTT